MSSTLNSSNTYTKAAYGLYMARQRAQLRQDVRDSLPALKIGQIVYVWRDDLDSDGEPTGQGQYETARVIRISRSKFEPGKWCARVERFADGPGRWTAVGPVDAFKTEHPDDDDDKRLPALNEHGANRFSDRVDNIKSTSGGTSAEYALRRLKRDHPDYAAAIAQIRALVADRAESDILARKVWNICQAVS